MNYFTDHIECTKKQSIEKKNLLLQLRENLNDIGLRCKTNHDVKLLKLHIDWVIVLNKKDLHLVLQKIRPLLDNEIDVT